MAVQNGDDSVEQAAAALAMDRTTWLGLLGRPDPSTRQTAARELTRLLGQPIPVNPAADPDSQKGCGSSWRRSGRRNSGATRHG